MENMDKVSDSTSLASRKLGIDITHALSAAGSNMSSFVHILQQSHPSNANKYEGDSDSNHDAMEMGTDVLAAPGSPPAGPPRIPLKQQKGGDGNSSTSATSFTGSTKKGLFTCLHKGCNGTFTTLANRKRHERLHSGEKPFRCPTENCEKTFARKYDLKVHNRTHTKEKPYTCEFAHCGKKFSRNSSLREHERNIHRLTSRSAPRSHVAILERARGLPHQSFSEDDQSNGQAAPATDIFQEAKAILGHLSCSHHQPPSNQEVMHGTTSIATMASSSAHLDRGEVLFKSPLHLVAEDDGDHSPRSPPRNVNFIAPEEKSGQIWEDLFQFQNLSHPGSN